MSGHLDAQLEVLAEHALACHDQDQPAPQALQEATRHLGAASASELRALRDAASLACAAMATHAAPPQLVERLRAAGRDFCRERRAQPAPMPAATDNLRAVPRAVPPGLPRWVPLATFALGAAAGVLASWLAWLPKNLDLPHAQRSELLLQGSARLTWKQGPSTKHGTVHGDVVWNAEQQQGYLRIEGLEPLRDDQQYQLWIVDGKRTGAPVDGGLFDLKAATEQVVPIQARLPIREAKAFVVTVEPRGGVVVSDQKDVVALAGL